MTRCLLSLLASAALVATGLAFVVAGARGLEGHVEGRVVIGVVEAAAALAVDGT